MPGPIISRAQWGARFNDGFGPAPLPASEVWLHHSVTNPAGEGATLEQDIDAVRALEQIGQVRFGGGLSYTFVIPPSGRIFQGHSVGRRGAHTQGHNTVGRGICLIGNYEVRTPSTAQIDAVRWLLAAGKTAGWWTKVKLSGGHRDVKQTSCPGVMAYNAIPAMNIVWKSAPPPVKTTLRLGHTGPGVLRLQTVLRAWYPDVPLFMAIRLTGNFDVITETAVRDFQRRAELDVDGIAGPLTLAALNIVL